MNKQELKTYICNAVDASAEKIIELAGSIRKEAEPGYEEYKTAAKVENIFRTLGLPVETKLANTGIKAVFDSGKYGPNVAVLGELDALVMPNHPEANPETGAAHACGHEMQIAALCGTAMALCSDVVRENISGRISFIAVPAEEGRSKEFDGITFMSGKAELIRRGVFDDVDMAMMTHANSQYGIAESSNGFVIKKVTFHGKAAHAGRPWNGINALSAARNALAAVDMQRDTFSDDEFIRIHGIISKGGEVVNIVPKEVELEYQLRAKTAAGVKALSDMFDRCMHGAAIAFGVKVDIRTRAGYMSVNNDPDLTLIHKANLSAVCPGAEFVNMHHRPSSTDMGDLSSVMPAIHPYSGGWSGTAHGVDFHWDDEYEAFVAPAKVMAMNVIDLLYGDAEEAEKIAGHKPLFTKEEYLDYLNSMEKALSY